MKKLFIADVQLHQNKFLAIEWHTVHLLDMNGNEIGYFKGDGIHDKYVKQTVMTAISMYLAHFTSTYGDRTVCPGQVIWLIHQP